MNVQAAPSPYTPVGGGNTGQGNPPVLGGQTPGTTGGLPALSGLSVTKNPMAEQLQSMGRGEDKMLVHMTPEEVNSLQGLALASGGSLTINPQTGLPEAGWLGRLLPTILGVAGAAFGLPTWALGLGVGAGKAAITGDLSKGLMAGLEAFGGAGLGQAAGIGGSLGNVGQSLGLSQGASAASAAGSAGMDAAGNILTSGGAIPMGVAPSAGTATMLGGAGEVGSTALTAGAKTPGFLSQFADATSLGQKGMLGTALPMAAGASVLGAVSDATAPKMPTLGDEESTFNYVPMRAGKREARFQTPEQMRQSGGAEFSYFTPSNPDPVPVYGNQGYAEGGAVGSPQQDFNSLVAMYQAQNPGAITASMYPTPSAPPQGAGAPAPTPTAPPAGIAPSPVGETMFNFNRPNSPTMQNPISNFRGDLGGFGSLVQLMGNQLTSQSRERNRTRSNPIMSLSGSGSRDTTMPRMEAFASGGAVDMQDGSFVVDARTVSELGNGSSNAGIEMLSRMGGRPVRGPGDGVSDSVKASIGGKQEARVARDEVVFSPEAVRRIGGGSAERGTEKLYALMERAHKARKKAGRGEDTGLRRGLA